MEDEEKRLSSLRERGTDRYVRGGTRQFLQIRIFLTD